MFKGIISDFDGTLATADKRVSNENLKAIDELFSRGKKFALSTGRMTASAMKLLDKLPFKPLIATYNGSEIVDSKTGERLISHKLDTEIILKIINFARERGLYSQVFNDRVIVEQINEVTHFYCNICKVEPVEVGDLYGFVERENFRSPKMMVINYKGEVDGYIKELESLFGDEVEVVRCYDGMIDVTPKGINKGSAVKDFCKIWQIDPSECVAVGDEGNDVAMFKTAGLGVAMKNAKEDVKPFADYVTKKGNDEDGVAEVIRKFLLGE